MVENFLYLNTEVVSFLQRLSLVLTSLISSLKILSMRKPCLGAEMARQVHFLDRAVSGKLSFEQIYRVSNVRLDFKPFCCARVSEHTIWLGLEPNQI